MTHTLLQFAALAVGLMVVIPALTLVHELGHAIAAALLVGGRVRVIQGPPPARLAFSVWRLDLRLRGPVGPHQVWVGWAAWGPHPDRRRHAIATLAGPLASALSAVACAFGAFHTGGFVGILLALVALAATAQTLSSGLPMRYGRRFGSFAGEASDGLRIRRLIEGRPEPVPGPVAGIR
jgi:hypothetical protein